MKRIPILFLFLLFLCVSCKDNEKEPVRSENHVDAARNFIRAALDGDFTLASRFMLQDSANLQYLDVAERSYKKLGADTVNAYRSASIIFFEPTVKLNDSTTTVIFANSFMNNLDTLRVMRVSGNWLVDLKYLYEHNLDTAYKNISIADSMR
jgi:hypothetical protein